MPIMTSNVRPGSIAFTSVSLWMIASRRPPNQVPTAEMISENTVVPTAATKPNVSAIGVPYSRATPRTRRWASVPAMPWTFPYTTNRASRSASGSNRMPSTASS